MLSSGTAQDGKLHLCVCNPHSAVGKTLPARELVSLRVLVHWAKCMWRSWSRRQADDPGPEEVSSGNVLIYDMGGDTFWRFFF